MLAVSNEVPTIARWIWEASGVWVSATRGFAHGPTCSEVEPATLVSIGGALSTELSQARGSFIDIFPCDDGESGDLLVELLREVTQFFQEGEKRDRRVPFPAVERRKGGL